MKKLFLPLFGVMVCFSPATQAISDTDYIDDNTALYCRTTQGKQILLEVDEKKNVMYMFGKDLQQPELVLKRESYQTQYNEYNGGGKNAGSEYVLQNGEFSYRISYGFSGTDSSGYEKYGYVDVYRNSKNISSVACISKSIYLK